MPPKGGSHWLTAPHVKVFEALGAIGDGRLRISTVTEACDPSVHHGDDDITAPVVRDVLVTASCVSSSLDKAYDIRMCYPSSAPARMVASSASGQSTVEDLASTPKPRGDNEQGKPESAQGQALIDAVRLRVPTPTGGISTATAEPSRIGAFCNDNGSVFQGYLGYPGIALLLVVGCLDASIADHASSSGSVAAVRSSSASTRLGDAAALVTGVPWKSIAVKHKNNWDKVAEEAIRDYTTPKFGVDGARRLNDFVDTVHRALSAVPIRRIGVASLKAHEAVGAKRRR